MEKYQLSTQSKTLLADLITPVSIYLKLRDQFPNTILLESADYHGHENSYSFICLAPIATFQVSDNTIHQDLPNNKKTSKVIDSQTNVSTALDSFIQSFSVQNQDKAVTINGFFGYTTYDAVQYFETIQFKTPTKEAHNIPCIRYSLYKYIIAINHFKNELTLVENLLPDEKSDLSRVESLLSNVNFATYPFQIQGGETSNVTDEEYVKMVKKGKEHCFRGDVFQIVLSRQFAQKFSGDEFNVYRTLRSINPSPYLFYFDYGNYKIFGSSPEAHLIVQDGEAIINPIAGTFRRTGDDEADKVLAQKLVGDPKENAEHVMLVDLARNDLSRSCAEVKVETYKEVQYYSHVIHLVSKVKGKLKPDANTIQVMGDTFPAGTLSGAPKYKALQLIDKYENQQRGYYGGCLGYIGFDGSFNQAIMIRSFLSKNNTLFSQAGAGIVSASDEYKELQEVNNKLAALKKALIQAEKIA